MGRLRRPRSSALSIAHPESIAALAAHISVQARSRRMRPSLGISCSLRRLSVVLRDAVHIAPACDVYRTAEGGLCSHIKSSYSSPKHRYRHLAVPCTSQPCRSFAQKDTRDVQRR
ncbi:hypothetical protein VTO73DRAFT_9566 [Trametes versicolor]